MAEHQVIRVLNVKVTFTQEPDSCDPNNQDLQELTIETADAGAGRYVVLSTKRWALDHISDLAPLVNHTLTMARYEFVPLAPEDRTTIFPADEQPF